jgi:hypothetical protein
MRWLEWEDSQRDFFLVLHSKTLLILWNTNTGEQVWECRIGFNAFGFSVDPFNSANLVFCSNGSTLVFVNDLKLHRAPNSQPASLALQNNESANASCSITQIVHHRAYPDLVFALLKDQVFAYLSNEMYCLGILREFRYETSHLSTPFGSLAFYSIGKRKRYISFSCLF